MEHSREPLLTIKRLEVFFPVKSENLFDLRKRCVRAVNDVNLTVYRGETLGLVGESGCGKTTLGKSVLQLIPPTGGEVVYHGRDGAARDLCKLSRREMNALRGKLQIVFQDPYSSLNPAFTIYQSMADPLAKFGYRTREARRKVIADILTEVNMRPEYMDRYPDEFSGGQRQRIGIARALSVQPELVVCDEAVSALDVSIQAQVLNLLKELKRQRQLTYIFITHDLSVVEYVSDRIAVMYLGKIVELAAAEDLYRNTAHPYSRALLSAIPVVDVDRRKRRMLLKGDVPSPIDLPPGCGFQGRCPHCEDICRIESPELRRFETDGREHHVACHFAERFLGGAGRRGNGDGT
ncbi:MAG: ABC transporter ATP-binding protein [Clostridiales bacterium]|nr:ABC transporter ATP-binding protein [Clostridiales bacterium]